MKKIVVIVSLALIMTACGDSAEKENNATVIPVPDTPAAQPSVQYQRIITAAYAGMIPCEDCDAVETTVTLFADTTFELRIAYIGKNPKDTAGLNKTISGKFMMHSDTVHLEGAESRYLKSDTALFQLDKTGRIMTGKKAEKYVLKKVK
ncbi:copper resistance protein NlpE [Flavitalea sp.]|nr:copper resistance protein NlpE N-terminal domain-containing protein [Flavitalea sp.]